MLLWVSEIGGLAKEPVMGQKFGGSHYGAMQPFKFRIKSLFNKTLWNSGVKPIDDIVDQNGNVLSDDASLQRHPFVPVKHLIYRLGFGNTSTMEVYAEIQSCVD